MTTCRCGHGQHQHRRAQRLSGWARGRGDTRPRPGTWVPCQALVRVPVAPYTTTLADGRQATVTPAPRTRVCPCRNWHPAEGAS